MGQCAVAAGVCARGAVRAVQGRGGGNDGDVVQAVLNQGVVLRDEAQGPNKGF